MLIEYDISENIILEKDWKLGHKEKGCLDIYVLDKNDKSFSEELQRLERRLDELVVITNQIKDENRSLKQRQDTLTAERATLLQKNEQVRARVEAMIGRLKAMEQGG